MAYGKAGGDVQPQAAANDMAHLGAALSIAKPAWGYQVNQHAMADARKVLKKLGYDMKSQERARRATNDELRKLLEHLSAGQKVRPTSINMVKVLGFAMFSTRRQDEITRIRWADLDEEEHRILVRDMKSPGQVIGNNVWCHIPYPAWEILQSMPRKCAEIFPALLNRLTHHCYIVEMGNEPYRLQHSTLAAQTKIKSRDRGPSNEGAST